MRPGVRARERREGTWYKKPESSAASQHFTTHSSLQTPPDLPPALSQGYAMTLLCLTIALLAAAGAHAGTLSGCDDCFSSPTQMDYGEAYFWGSQYNAFAVSQHK